MDDEGQQTSPADNSPARSQRSSNSTSSRGTSLRSAYTAATKSREQSPSNPSRAAGGDAASGAGGAAAAAVSNKKMLKIGANVRFRGDVMECNTVVLCGRLQVGAFFALVVFSRDVHTHRQFFRCTDVVCLWRSFICGDGQQMRLPTLLLACAACSRLLKTRPKKQARWHEAAEGPPHLSP